MTEDEIRAIEDRVNAATPGPWFTQKPLVNSEGWSEGVLIAATAPGSQNRVFAMPPGGSSPGADQRFIAYARIDIPALIAALRAEMARAKSDASES